MSVENKKIIPVANGGKSVIMSSPSLSQLFLIKPVDGGRLNGIKIESRIQGNHMEHANGQTLSSALSDFRRARNQAFIKEIVARFTGESVELLAYEEVRKKLITLGSAEHGLEDIPSLTK